MRRLLVVLLLVLAGLLPATTAWADDSAQQSFSASGLNTLQLSVENGNIVVTAADQSTVTITSALTNGFVPATFRQTGSVLSGDVANPGDDVTVSVPLGLALSLHASNGDITVTGSLGALSLTADDGSISVQGRSGQAVTMQASNGDIRVSGYSGGGSIGDANGDVTLTLPSDAGAQLNLTTTNGQIQVSGTRQSSSQVSTTFNGGGPTFTVLDSNGDITAQ